MAPQGQGPLGGTSSSAFGIQPVEPIKRSGKADVLAILAPERDQNFRGKIARTGSIRLIMNGGLCREKLPQCWGPTGQRLAAEIANTEFTMRFP